MGGRRGHRKSSRHRREPDHPRGPPTGPLTLAPPPGRSSRSGLRKAARACALPGARAPRVPPQPALRSLCEEDVPDDPRGELRWCLSKLRGTVRRAPARGAGGRATASGSTLRTACVDAAEDLGRRHSRVGSAPRRTAAGAAALLTAKSLEDLEVDRSPASTAGPRAAAAVSRLHAALLEQLVARARGERGLRSPRNLAGDRTPLINMSTRCYSPCLRPARPAREGRNSRTPAPAGSRRRALDTQPSCARAPRRRRSPQPPDAPCRCRPRCRQAADPDGSVSGPCAGLDRGDAVCLDRDRRRPGSWRCGRAAWPHV